MRWYIAGPMRNVPKYNFPAFFEAQELLRKKHPKAKVFNPAEIDIELDGFDPRMLPDDTDWGQIPDQLCLEEVVNRDLGSIQSCTHLYLLPGWSKSTGAKAEVAVARWLGLTIEGAVDEDKVYPEEVRSVSSSGGQKGEKPARFDLIPAEELWELAEHYGKGVAKYPDKDGIPNWTRGYEWHKNFAALMRHAWQFWMNVDKDDIDPELGSHHLIAVVWHAMTLRWFSKHRQEFDDRPHTRKEK